MNPFESVIPGYVATIDRDHRKGALQGGAIGALAGGIGLTALNYAVAGNAEDTLKLLLQGGAFGAVVGAVVGLVLGAPDAGEASP